MPFHTIHRGSTYCHENGLRRRVGERPAKDVSPHPTAAKAAARHAMPPCARRVLEAIGSSGRVAHRHHVTAVDLVDCDGESLGTGQVDIAG